MSTRSGPEPWKRILLNLVGMEISSKIYTHQIYPACMTSQHTVLFYGEPFSISEDMTYKFIIYFKDIYNL